MTRFEEILARRPDVEFAVALSSETIEQFQALGFAHVARITSDEEVAWLGELYDAVFEERLEAVPGGYFDLARPYESPGEDLLPQVIAPEARFRELRHTAVFRNGRRLAAELLGVDAAALRGWGHMIRKPPRVGAALPWHQDEAYWDPAFDYVALGVWTPLDPATTESGCMRFLPRSHTGPVRKHRHIGDDANTHGLETDDGIDESQAVAVPLAPGGATFHHCRTVHASGPNTSARVRRAWANEFQLAPTQRAQRYERPWVDEGQQAWERRAR